MLINEFFKDYIKIKLSDLNPNINNICKNHNKN